MKKVILIILGIFFLIGFLYGVYFLINEPGQPKKEIIYYKTTDKERPQVQVKNNFLDFGKMKVSDEKKGEFNIKNIGQKPLQVFAGSSSCSCTFGQVEINGQLTKEFGMHSNSNWVGEIKPGETAKVFVIYRPFVMPVYGLVEREVYLSTNDPQNPKISFKVRAFVN